MENDNSIVLSEVSLIYKVVNGVHYFFGNDEWSVGLAIIAEDYEIAKKEAMIQLRILLRENHKVCCGEWEII